MRRQTWIYGTVVAGVATLATAASYADDKKADALPGPIDSLSDLQDTAKLVFKLADTNNDDQISQKEAVDAGNLLVGGFFFRADANGDGVLTAQEAQQARETLYMQQPLLRFIVERAKPTNGTAGNLPQNNQPIVAGTANDPARVVQSFTADPMGTIGNLLDTNRDQKIEASELRQAVQTGVQTLFLVADTNQDGQLSPYELNAAVTEVAKSAVQTAFQVADGDRNGMLSMDEYDKALAEPAHAVFRVLDANGDNQLTLAELQRAEQIIADQIQRLQVPEPGNSVSNQIQQGRNRGAVNQPVQAAPTASPSSPPVAPR
jgi:EF hand